MNRTELEGGRWRTFHAERDGPHGVLHECADGHTWVEQPDGGVSPSWGYGLTSVQYDQPPNRCPEPKRGWSIYDKKFRADQGDAHHGYRCPSCGAVHYVGGCGMGVRCDPWNTADPPCEPPKPVCKKPAVRTLYWLDGDWTQVRQLELPL